MLDYIYYLYSSFFFIDPATTEIYTLSLHDALRSQAEGLDRHVDVVVAQQPADSVAEARSEEHTSELQSRPHLVCRLLLEKKNIIFQIITALWFLHDKKRLFIIITSRVIFSLII